MMFHANMSSDFVVINDLKITVPSGVKYVTINMYDVVEGWFDRPFISEGRWYSDFDNSIRIGYLEYDDEDEYTGRWSVYEVQY